MAGNPVGWFEIYVDDMERAKAFYETVLNVKLERLEDPVNPDSGLQMWAFDSDMNTYGAPGSLVKMDEMKAGGNSVLVYFSCEDCAAEESRIAAAGGQVAQSKMSIGEYGFVAHGIDTEGNMFGLHSQQ